MEAEGGPHEAMFLVLAYLPLQSLLSMSQVCKSIKNAISNDVLIWLDIVVETPLNLRVTDQILMEFTSKAHGRLRTLALLNCVNVTDNALLSMVSENPLLNKLYIPACTGLTPEGVVLAVKTLTEKPNNNFTTLKINGIYRIKQEHLLTLESYLTKTTERKPIFYHKYRNSSFLNLDDDTHHIDVEICPKCKEVKLVFDCPREKCRGKKERSKIECRGCSHCITRCESCGKCITNEDEDEQGETICNDMVCLSCWLCLPKCNLCNKPVCPRHADQQLNPPGCRPGGFVCEFCHSFLI